MPAIPSRRDRRAHYSLVRSKTKHTGPALAPWGQTKLCVPNPRPGQVVDGLNADGTKRLRACTFGGHFNGVPAQISAARNRYVPSAAAATTLSARKRRADNAARNFATGHWQYGVIPAVTA